MDPVTHAQVQQAVETHNITQWALRSCSICQQPLYYVFEDGKVGFAPGCGCTDSGMIYARTYAQVAETFNMQTPEVRQRMWDSFIKSGTT